MILSTAEPDLGVYLRDQKRDKLPSDIRKEIESLESDYQSKYKEYQSELSEVEAIKIESTELEKSKERLNQSINELGGAWASSQLDAKAKEESLKKLSAVNFKLRLNP